MAKQRNDGRSFEKLNYLIQQAMKESLNTKVYFNHFINGIKGRRRQFDIYIESQVNGFDFNIAIECKDEGRKIEVGKIESFSMKCDACKIDKRIMISPVGFSIGARDTADEYRIKLYTLSEISSETILEWVNVEEIKKVGTNFHIERVIITLDNNSSFTVGSKEWPDDSKVVNKEGEFTLKDFIMDNYDALYSNMMNHLTKLFENKISTVKEGEYLHYFDLENIATQDIGVRLVDKKENLHQIIKIHFFIKSITKVEKPEKTNIRKFKQLESENGIDVVSSSFINTETLNLIKKNELDDYEVFLTDSNGEATKLVCYDFDVE